jgi:hypothetical protein
MPAWNNLNNAFRYLEKFIANKHALQKFDLSEIDLALVSNFKGGNASIVEPLETLAKKLPFYSAKLKQIDDLINRRPLCNLSKVERTKLGQKAMEFASLANKKCDKHISGFGASYASALLAAYFPDTLPVLDRLVLSETKIIKDRIKDRAKQVADIKQYYPKLIEYFFEALKNERHLTLREIDGNLFEKNQKRRREARKRSKKVHKHQASPTRNRSVS